MGLEIVSVLVCLHTYLYFSYVKHATTKHSTENEKERNTQHTKNCNNSEASFAEISAFLCSRWIYVQLLTRLNDFFFVLVLEHITRMLRNQA